MFAPDHWIYYVLLAANVGNFDHLATHFLNLVAPEQNSVYLELIIVEKSRRSYIFDASTTFNTFQTFIQTVLVLPEK